MIIGCFNSGTVIGNGRRYNESEVGGISGAAREGVEIYDCYNRGTIQGTTNFAGGIIGAFGWSGTTVAYVQRCFNLGSVSTNGDFGSLVRELS